MSKSKKKLNEQEVHQHCEDKLHRYRMNKIHFDRLWFTSLLMYRGEQWITYDVNLGQFRRTNQRRAIPRPVTNKFAPTMNSIIAALSRFDPKIQIAPQTDRYEDMTMAMSANQIIKVCEHEVNWDNLKQEFLPWLANTGNAFLITGVDELGGPMVNYLDVSCPQCGAEKEIEETEEPPMCDNCAQAGVQVQMMPEIDEETGEPETDQRPAGAISVELSSVFNMFFDYRIPEMQDQETIIRITTKNVQWLKRHYPKLADQIQPTKREELNSRMLMSLSSYFYTATEKPYEETCDIVEAWHKPTDMFPGGFYCQYIDPKLFLELKPYPWTTKEGIAFYPIVHYKYDRMAGSALARTPAFDLIEKQKTRNRVEAIGEMILTRTSNPVWLKPTPGTNTVITGHVGQEIEYDANQTNGHAPARIEAAQLPPAIQYWLDRIDKDFDVITAQGEIANGQRPLSVKTGYAIQKLQEISQDRQTSLFTNFAIATAQWQIQALEIFRMITPVGRYAKILGDNNQWTIKKLKATDLQGSVDIWAEPGAWSPKSHLEKLATLEMFIQMGLVDINDPLQKLRIHREYGMPGLLPDADADDAYIAREQDRFKQGQPIQVSPLDNHQMHLARHLDYWKSEGFESLPEQLRQIFIQHIIETQYWAMTGQPPPTPGQVGSGQPGQSGIGGQPQGPGGVPGSAPSALPNQQGV